LACCWALRGHVVVDHHQPRRVALQAGAAGQQRLGVGVLRALEDLLHGAVLADLPVAHHHHLVGDLAHQAQVVADEEHAHLVRGLELAQQLQDLALDGDVQRRGGLVGDQQLGLAGQRHGDHHALLLAAGHLVRVGLQAARRLGDAHLVEQLLGALPGRSLPQAHVLHQRLAQLRADVEHRVQRAHRVLEDAGDLLATQRLQVAQAKAQQVLPLPEDAAAALGVVGQQVQHAHRGDALARARFAHQGHGLVGVDVEGHALHGLGAHALAHAEGHAQVLDRKQLAHRVLTPDRAAWGRARRAAHRPSAKRPSRRPP
jgi:hypothetical protein